MRTPDAKELVDMLPRERWINVTEEIDRLFPQADMMARKQMQSKAIQKLNRLYDWGAIDKRTEHRRAYWYVPEGVTVCRACR